MNPHAKEFVPAHIKKKREEEADLTKQLDDVHLATPATATTTTNNNSSSNNNKTINENGDPNCNGNSTTTTTTTHQNNQLHDLEDDRYLLKAGENICEFNGEQFIIPGDDDLGQNDNGYNDDDEDDDEYGNHHAPRAGYDFGNAEDNEDEDVCNAFEEFLENLPDKEDGPHQQQQQQHGNARGQSHNQDGGDVDKV